MAAEFLKAVDLGLKLSKRIYYGKDANTIAPRPPEMMAEDESYLPTAVMAYAEIREPAIVDNPDVPSYQPYVHGRCDPPVLIPLHMHGVSMEVDCYLDTAFVTVSGTWRVHCVASNRRCCCRIAVPIGEQGSVLGVEVESPLKSYSTNLISLEAAADAARVANSKDGFLIKGRIYTVKIPAVDGGTMLSIKVHWSQKLWYNDGQFCLNVPFSFPSYVVPVVKKLSKKEHILVNVNSGAGSETLCESSNHPLKRIAKEALCSRFSYEREVSFWSVNDFNLSYSISSSRIVGGLLLQPPALQDYDQREMFSFYLYPGKRQNSEVFSKEVVFLVDISASMQGNPLENVKSALLGALIKLNSQDTFNIIAFNGSPLLFSPSLVPATNEMVNKASEWVETHFVAEGSTKISASLNQAINLFSKTGLSLPMIFLITDGAVEEEKDICNAMRDHLRKGDLTTPRICTFGIGSYCNQYFLQMLADIGRGYYDSAIDIGEISTRLGRLIESASSVILADISIDALKYLDSVEVFAGRQINALTAQAWLSGTKQLEEKVTKLSLLTGVPSEYTSMTLIETDKGKLPSKSKTEKEKKGDIKEQRIIFLRSLGIGFGDIVATAENRSPEQVEPKLYQTSEVVMKAASDMCSKLIDKLCCMCFIRCCSSMNDQCAIAFTQLCTALACCECIMVCCEICSGD